MRTFILLFVVLFSTPLFAEEPASGKQLLAAADEIADEVAAIRGLAIKKQIKRGIKNKKELRETLLVKLAEEVTDAQLEGEADVMKAFGMIPQDLNYKQMLLDVLTEQVAGFYDQKAKELYVMEGIPLSLQKPAMAHELYHAIQDQHFDILSMQAGFNTTENADFSFARSALIEGDATVLMMDYQMKGQLPPGQSVADLPMVTDMLANFNFSSLAAMEQMMGGTPDENQPSLSDSALSKAPLVFRESLIFPYFGGMRFVVQVKQGRTWKEFDEVYKNPPVSTEQILHPEKYFAQEEPIMLFYDVAKTLPDYTPIFDSVWGEFEWKMYFSSHGVDGTMAHAGWGGDSVRGYKKGDNVIAIATTVLDSLSDSKEFYGSVDEVLKKRYPKATPIKESGKNGESTCYQIGDTRAYVERWGDMVLLIEGVPSKVVDGKETDPTLYKTRQALWNSLKRRPFREVYNERLEKAGK